MHIELILGDDWELHFELMYEVCNYDVLKFFSPSGSFILIRYPITYK